MRNRVFWNSPHTRIFSSLTLLGVTALAVAGCGGGGGGSSSTNGGTTNGTTPPAGSTVSITGTVKDTSTSNAAVVNSVVTIVGTTLSTRTDSSGNFSFTNVPATATAFRVTNPNVATYFSYANYGGKLYDVINCTLPLPTLHTGTNTIGEVDLVVSGNSPPPAPSSGCP